MLPLSPVSPDDIIHYTETVSYPDKKGKDRTWTVSVIEHNGSYRIETISGVSGGKQIVAAD